MVNVNVARAVRKQYTLKGTPTVLVLDSAGKELERLVGGTAIPALKRTLEAGLEAFGKKR